MSSKSLCINVTQDIVFYTVIGEIEHGLHKNIRSVNIIATFYDEENNIIGQSESHPVIKILKPGVKSPFMIHWKIDEKYPASYELALTYENTTEDPVKELQIMHHSNYTDENGYFVVEGEVKNVEWRKAVSVTVYCSYYDMEGKIILVTNSLFATDIESGQKAYFTVTSEPYRITPASY